MCGGTQARRLWEKGALHTVRCRVCQMVYANPFSARLASGAFYDQEEAAYYLSPKKLASDYAPVRFERELRLFRRWCTGGRVLDVGCSTGGFLYALGQRHPGDYQTLGMDVTRAALEYATSRGVPVRPGSFLEAGFRAEFEALTLWAVVEHLSDPRAFLERAGAALKPGGHCFVLVPNLGSLAVRLLGARYRYIMPDHLNYFDQHTLVRLVRDIPDFAVVQTGSMHFNPMVIWQDWGQPRDRVPDAERGELLARTTALKQKSWLKPVKFGYTLCERALGSARLADNLSVIPQKQPGEAKAALSG